MPKIVYDIEFKIDSNAAKTAGAQLDKSVGGSSEKIEQSSNAFKELNQQLKLVQSEANKTNAVFRNQLQNVGALNKATVKSASLAQKQIALIKTQKNEILELARGTDLNARETASLNNSYAQLENKEKQLIATLKKHRKELAFVEEAQENLQNTTRSTSKITSGANQVFFSFSDGVQDAAQFQFGFAQGMRAIGNNVSFTAELLAQLNKNAKASNITLGQALMKSLGGVGGALLALNLVISASTILMGAFGDKLFKAKEETDEFKDAVQDLSKELEDFDDLIQQISERGLDPVVSDLNREKRLLGLAKRREQSIQDELDLAKARKKVADDEFETLKKSGQVVLFTEEEYWAQKRAADEVKRLEGELSKAKATTEQIRLDFISMGDDATKALGISGENFVEGDETFSFAFGTLESQESLLDQLLNLSKQKREEFKQEQKEGIIQTEGELFALRQAQIDKENAFRLQKEKELQSVLIQLSQTSAQSRVRVNQIAFQSIQGLAQGLIGSSKAGAIALLALEKAAAISQVIIQGNADAAKAQSVASTYAAQSLTPFGPNPLAIAAAANAQAQVGVIKGNTAKAVALIAATGLGQAAAIGFSGGSSGGGGGGVGTSSLESSNAFITRTGEVTPPSFQPLPPNSQNSQPKFIIENKVTPRGLATVVRQGETEIRASQITV